MWPRAGEHEGGPGLVVPMPAWYLHGDQRSLQSLKRSVACPELVESRLESLLAGRERRV